MDHQLPYRHPGQGGYAEEKECQQDQIHPGKQRQPGSIDLAQRIEGGALHLHGVAAAVFPELRQNQDHKQRRRHTQTAPGMQIAVGNLQQQAQGEQKDRLKQPPVLFDIFTLLIEKFQIGHGVFRFSRNECCFGYFQGALYFCFITGDFHMKIIFDLVAHRISSFPKSRASSSLARLILYFTSGSPMPRILAISFCFTS